MDSSCEIFLDGPGGRDEVLTLVSGLISGEPAGSRVVASGVRALVQLNDDHSVQGKLDFPAGYFEFPFLVELLFDDDASPESAARTTGALLEAFWAQGWPAVASCEYDDLLPHRGGFNTPELPWPGR